MSLLVCFAAPAAAQSSRASFVQALDRMMVSMAAESARDGRLTRELYRPLLDELVLDNFMALEEAHWNGGLATLPADPLRFNLAPRLSGYSPIGEKDLANQAGYVAARPATIGVLLDIASRVKSGPLEVTSLVRHSEYQGALQATNVNANTAVPMHTMGLAFDIALVNTRLETVYEIRDVLRQMRRAGDILFVGERRQLVFHVVPHPSRLGHYHDVYAQSLGMPPADGFSPVVAFTPARAASARGSLTPSVTAEVVAVVPSSEIAAEWWAADGVAADLTVDVISDPLELVVQGELEVQATGAPMPLHALLVTLLALVRRVVTRPPGALRLFEPAVPPGPHPIA